MNERGERSTTFNRRNSFSPYFSTNGNEKEQKTIAFEAAFHSQTEWVSGQIDV